VHWINTEEIPMVSCLNMTYTNHTLSSRDVNETLGPETETRPRPLAFYPRRDPPKIFRNRDETEAFNLGLETRPRPSEAETDTFSRDLFV
jgi:hypothetical protein